MNETSFARILLANARPRHCVPGKPIRHTQGRDLCRTARRACPVLTGWAGASHPSSYPPVISSLTNEALDN
jgi:hypothetical protein